MAITVACGGCGKQYRVDERFAGKKVRCKSCGAALTVPSPTPHGPVEESDPFEALVAMERAATPKPGDYSPIPSAQATPPVPMSYAAPVPRTRRVSQGSSRRYSEFLDLWLPRILVLLFYAPMVVLGLVGAIFNPLPPVSILLLLISISLLAFVILPLASVGLNIAAGQMDFEVEDDPRFKILAAYCPVPAAMVICAVLSLGAGILLGVWAHLTGFAAMKLLGASLLLGVLLGCTVSMFLIWLLFRLRFVQALYAWIMTSLFYLLGAVVAGFAMFLVLLVIAAILEKSGWHPPVAAAPAPVPAPTVARRLPRMVSPSVSSNVPLEVTRRIGPDGRTTEITRFPGGGVVVRSWGTGRQPDQPRLGNQSNSNSAAGAGTSGGLRAIPNYPPRIAPPLIVRPAVPPVRMPLPKPIGFVERFAQQKSDFVSQISAPELGEAVREIVHPLTPSHWTAVVKQVSANQDTVELWNLQDGKKEAEASFIHEAGERPSYAVSPTGQYVARVVKWPKLSVRVWSFPEAKEVRSIPLNERFGEAAIQGFLTGDMMAVRRSLGGKSGMEMFNAATGGHGKQVPLEHFQSSANNGVVSPDGRYFALTGRQPHTGRPQVEFYDLTGPSGGYRWHEMTELDAIAADRPAGMAFSPDGKKLAALFRRNGDGVVFCWQAPGGKPLGSFEVALPDRVTVPGGGGRGLDWVQDGAAWLIDGDVLLDASTGRPIGSLNAPPSTGQWVTASDTCVLRYATGAREGIATVKLNAGKLAATTRPAH